MQILNDWDVNKIIRANPIPILEAMLEDSKRIYFCGRLIHALHNFLEDKIIWWDYSYRHGLNTIGLEQFAKDKGWLTHTIYWVKPYGYASQGSRTWRDQLLKEFIDHKKKEDELKS